MPVSFTAHNIRLDDGTRTKPEAPPMESLPWLRAAKRLLYTLYPGDRKGVSLVDIGCLEGGYAVEFARAGFDVLGIDIRQENLAACELVKAGTDLPNLRFAKDNALNVAAHGPFDVAFCCGLLYHLDRPREFLRTLGAVTKKVAILQTHFAPERSVVWDKLPRPARRLAGRASLLAGGQFNLSTIVDHEGLSGRWFREFARRTSISKQEKLRWAAWQNSDSFWLRRSSLLRAIEDAGFDVVMEQFDSLEPEIDASMNRGYYKTDCRGTFVGIKSAT